MTAAINTGCFITKTICNETPGVNMSRENNLKENLLVVLLSQALLTVFET